MQASVEHVRDLLVVAISGRLDTVSAPAFDAQMAPLLAQPRPHILLDLAAVSYISSAGLRSILQLVKHASAHGGRVGICSAPHPIMEVIEISGFPGLLDLYPDRQSALNARPA